MAAVSQAGIGRTCRELRDGEATAAAEPELGVVACWWCVGPATWTGGPELCESGLLAAVALLGATSIPT
jgi:hypothetical protein